MNPDKTWQKLMTGMMQRNRPMIAEAADSLVGWLERDGFMPAEVTLGPALRWMNRKQLLAYLRDVRAVAEMV